MSSIIELSKEELRLLQLIELEMLVEVDRICRKNKIHYSIDAGSLLGAVRHKGFIPWDDDLDVMFLHNDYERFYEACKTDLDTSRFFFQDYRNDPGYRWGYGKIRRIGTEYIKYGQEKLKQRTGICIDVFDFENVPDSERERNRFIKQMFCIRKTLYSALGRTNEKTAIMRFWYSILYLIPSSFVHKLRKGITSKYLHQDTQNVACMMWPIKKCPNGFPRSLFSSFIDLEFEGIHAMAIQGYDEYLKMRYGNYMILPPENQRKGVMDAVEYKFINITHEEIIERYRNTLIEY